MNTNEELKTRPDMETEKVKWHEGCMPVALVLMIGIIAWAAVEIVQIIKNCP